MSETIVFAGRTGYVSSRTMAQLLKTGGHVADINLPAGAEQPAKVQLLSIVVPCYNEQEMIAATIKRLLVVCSQLVNLDVELIFVDDGSRDRTCELLREFAKEDHHIKLIVLARNFGHQIAVTAGVDAAAGDAVIIID